MYRRDPLYTRHIRLRNGINAFRLLQYQGIYRSAIRGIELFRALIVYGYPRTKVEIQGASNVPRIRPSTLSVIRKQDAAQLRQRERCLGTPVGTDTLIPSIAKPRYVHVFA